MKSDNVILLENSRANPWEDMIESQLNFRFGYDQKPRYSYFESGNPRPGEPKFYHTDSNLSFCRIALVPNLTGTGNILSIAGTEIEVTQGCGEFVTSAPAVQELLTLAGVEHHARVPYFEALLESSRWMVKRAILTIIAFRLIRPAGYILPGHTVVQR